MLQNKIYIAIRVLTLTCIVFVLSSCESKLQYRWCITKEGNKIWIEETQTSFDYCWEGNAIDYSINGEGILYKYQGDKLVETKKLHAYYGSISEQSICIVSDNEKYIGEIQSGKYNGFGVLIKPHETIIGYFIESKANGYCAFYKDGKLQYKGMWKNHQFHGDGIQYIGNDSIIGVWDNGKIAKVFIEQETQRGRYLGYIENNLPNGEGTLYYKNGWVYSGFWKNGEWFGKGKLTTNDFVYNGFWQGGKPSGKGMVVYSNGSYYEGDWKDGKRDGWGDSYFLDSSYYAGEWVNGEYDGDGMFLFSDGSRYDGQWEKGLQQGNGVYESRDYTYYGQWEEGWINGEGRIEYANGDFYEGHFVENARYGLGYYRFNNGNSYEGEFVDDLFNGLGVFRFNDGTVYEGEFSKGKIYGDGTYYCVIGKDTTAITAHWDGTNNFPKKASILFSNGDVYEGEIINGKPTNNGVWYPNEASFWHDKIVSANDYYKLHKETIDKVVTITSISLTIVAAVAATVAATMVSPGTATVAATMVSPGTAASVLMATEKASFVANEVINDADMAVTVSSFVIDGDYSRAAGEIAVNAAFILVPKGLTKVLKSNPARKAAIKLSKSAISVAIRKSTISISRSKPFKKIMVVTIDKTRKIKNTFVSSKINNLKKFSKSKIGKKIVRRQLTKQTMKNKRLIAKVFKKLKVPDKLQSELIDEMNVDKELETLIVQNPEFNIKRWLNTKRKVDKSLIAKGARNRQYAGKNFYFHPSLNPNMQSTLKRKNTFSNYTKEELLALDKQFPNGVPYTKSGFPDFVKAGACKLDKKGNLIKIEMPNGTFSGNREKDFEIAREYAKKKYGKTINEQGYIWHHLEGSPASMVLVKTECHEICRHAGGHSLSKNALNIK